STQEFREDAAQTRPYRIAGPASARPDVLVRALEARGLAVEPAAAHGQPRAGVVVGLRGETAAAELLADLVREGVPV
ncbi:hypothetical protein, partial [Salmonella enterica]